MTGTSPCGLGFDQQLPDTREMSSAAAIGEEAIMADTVEAVGQVVQKKAADELIRAERHQAWRVAMTIVAPAEGHTGLIGADQAAIGDGDTVGVAPEIGKDMFW
jgi:hypothetical protein